MRFCRATRCMRASTAAVCCSIPKTSPRKRRSRLRRRRAARPEMTFFKRSKFAGFVGEKNRVPDGVWMKCTSCKKPVYRSEVEENQYICPACGFHFRIGARKRLEHLLDPETFVESHADIKSADPLKFAVGKETYAQRIERAQTETGLD